MRKILTLSALLLSAACAGKQVIVTTPPAQCHKLIPASWGTGVEAAPVPQNTDVAEWMGKPLTPAMVAAIAAPWAQGYIAQDAQLDKANGRTADTISITTTCEELVNAARPK